MTALLLRGVAITAAPHAGAGG